MLTQHSLTLREWRGELVNLADKLLADLAEQGPQFKKKKKLYGRDSQIFPHPKNKNIVNCKFNPAYPSSEGLQLNEEKATFHL